MSKTNPDYESMSVADQVREGLRQSLAHARGELTLRTTSLPLPPPKLTGRRVVAIRKKVGMSQAVFASFLNVPTRTLQSWEQGARVPKASEARLLQIADVAPEQFQALIFRAGSTRKRVARKSAASRRAAA